LTAQLRKIRAVVSRPTGTIPYSVGNQQQATDDRDILQEMIEFVIEYVGGR
jgi:hypothetical protein